MIMIKELHPAVFRLIKTLKNGKPISDPKQILDHLLCVLITILRIECRCFLNDIPDGVITMFWPRKRKALLKAKVNLLIKRIILTKPI